MTTEGPRSAGRVVITGMGVVSPYGAGLDRLQAGLEEDRPARVVTDVLAPGEVPANTWRRLDRGSKMAVLAVREALATAAIADPAAAGVVLGTMMAGSTSLDAYLRTVMIDGLDAASPMLFPLTVPNAPAAQCSILIGLHGPGLTVCSMEASGLEAVVVGTDLIRAGAAPMVVAGGVDDLPARVVEAWRRLRLTAHAGMTGTENGFLPGEGAYVVTLEAVGEARARGAVVRAEVLGTGMAHAGRGSHRWPGAIGPAVAAIHGALESAGIGPGDLGSVVTTANGSRTLGAFETAVLREALGGRADRLPTVNIKRLIGESGAASACGAIAAVLSIRGDRMPSPALGLAAQPASRLRAPVLVHALGTGGACVSLILGPPVAGS